MSEVKILSWFKPSIGAILNDKFVIAVAVTCHFWNEPLFLCSSILFFSQPEIVITKNHWCKMKKKEKTILIYREDNQERKKTKTKQSLLNGQSYDYPCQLTFCSQQNNSNNMMLTGFQTNGNCISQPPSKRLALSKQLLLPCLTSDFKEKSCFDLAGVFCATQPTLSHKTDKKQKVVILLNPSKP